MKSPKTAQELLYECIRELANQSASPKSRKLIEAGMERLGCKFLTEETYFTEMRAEADLERTAK